MLYYMLHCTLHRMLHWMLHAMLYCTLPRMAHAAHPKWSLWSPKNRPPEASIISPNGVKLTSRYPIPSPFAWSRELIIPRGTACHFGTRPHTSATKL
jgi:hypothetical protein